MIAVALWEKRSSTPSSCSAFLSMPAISKGFSSVAKNEFGHNRNDKLFATTSMPPDNERTLYDLLEASPEDTAAELRRKYTRLARQKHPDAIAGRNKGDRNGEQQKQSGADFAEITAAWSVLSNPKERRKYDRSLKAEKIGSMFETLFDAGIRNAVPIIKKTGTAAGNAMDRVQMESKLRSIEARIDRERTRGLDAKKRASELPSNRLKALKKTPFTKLTSAEALRFLEQFQSINNKVASSLSKEELATATPKGGGKSMGDSLKKEIQKLAEIEVEERKQQRELNSRQRDSSAAERKVENAVTAEKRAAQTVEEAKQRLKDALKEIENTEKAQMSAIEDEQKAVASLDAIMASMKRHAKKVSSAVQSTQGINFQQESAFLMSESASLESVTKELRRQANQLKRVEQAMNGAARAEEMAIKKLEDSKEALKAASEAITSGEKARTEVQKIEQQATAKFNQISASLKMQTERVRDDLRAREGDAIKKEAAFLQKESARSQSLVKEMQVELNLLKKEQQQSSS